MHSTRINYFFFSDESTENTGIFQLTQFWENMLEVSKRLSVSCSKLYMCFGKPPRPNDEEGKSEFIVLILILLFRPFIYTNLNSFMTVLVLNFKNKFVVLSLRGWISFKLCIIDYSYIINISTRCFGLCHGRRSYPSDNSKVLTKDIWHRTT